MAKVSMTYSWHNISDQYKNNKIKYIPENSRNCRWYVFLFRLEFLYS